MSQPVYNYWNGCSTGGRQGYLLAQELGGELDGILASAPAIYWTRLQTAQMWGQILMSQLLGGPISAANFNQATASALQACDAIDGVSDGFIDDPRACHFSATANICGTPTAPATNCLTAHGSDVIDRIWDGPRNAGGQRIWFGLDRGTNLAALNGTPPFPLGVTQFHWNEHDRTFDWRTVSIDEYAQIAQDGSRNIADVTDTFGDLEVFRRHGGKLLTFVGCHLFGALVNWVENGAAPAQIVARTTSGTVTRPLCPYPQTAIYHGGDRNLAASFRRRRSSGPPDRRRNGSTTSSRLCSLGPHRQYQPSGACPVRRSARQQYQIVHRRASAARRGALTRHALGATLGPLSAAVRLLGAAALRSGESRELTGLIRRHIMNG